MPEAKLAREVILARIRSSNPPENDEMRLIQEWMGIPRPFRKKGSLAAEDRLDLFEDRLRDYGGGIHHASSEIELPQVIASAIAARGLSTATLAMPCGNFAGSACQSPTPRNQPASR